MATPRVSCPVLVGQRFGRLTVIADAGIRRYATGRTVREWLCRCDCGGERTAIAPNLRAGRTASCGCLHRENVHRTHGATDTPEYGIWSRMLHRCFNPNDAAWRNYGGRGITVCDRWRGPHGFQTFLADVGPRPSPDHSIDRYPDNDGPYAPGNVRWATMKEQNRNKRNTRRVEHEGRTLAVSDWAEEIGIRRGTLIARLDLGIPPEEALTRPVERKPRRK